MNQTEREEMEHQIKGLEGLRDEKLTYLRNARNFDEYYFKVLRDKNNLVCQIVAMKNRLKRISNPREIGVEPMKVPTHLSSNPILGY
jgi:hypothetical protein